MQNYRAAASVALAIHTGAQNALQYVRIVEHQQRRFAVIGSIALILAQSASPAPALPEMEQAQFEFRRCGASDIEKICFYAAAPEEGHDILRRRATTSSIWWCERTFIW